MADLKFSPEDNHEFEVGDCVYELRAYSGEDFTGLDPEFLVLPAEVIPADSPDSPVFVEFLRSKISSMGNPELLYTVAYLGSVEAG